MQQYCSNAAMQQDLEVLLGLLRDRKSGGDAAILLLRIKIGNNRSEVRNEQSAAQCVLHVMTGCRQQMVRQAPDVA